MFRTRTRVQRSPKGGAVLELPPAIAELLQLDAGSRIVVEAEGSGVWIQVAQDSLEDRLQESPLEPAAWPRASDDLRDPPRGRESL